MIFSLLVVDDTSGTKNFFRRTNEWQGSKTGQVVMGFTPFALKIDSNKCTVGLQANDPIWA